MVILVYPIRQICLHIASTYFVANPANTRHCYNVRLMQLTLLLTHIVAMPAKMLNRHSLI